MTTPKVSRKLARGLPDSERATPGMLVQSTHHFRAKRGEQSEHHPPAARIRSGGNGGGIGFDIAGNFVSEGFNLISTGSGSAGFTNGILADQVGDDTNQINLQIAPLQMNGGLTPTHALLPGSPAIDQGNSFGIRLDQRHHPRRHDYSSIANSSGGNGADIGAFELDE